MNNLPFKIDQRKITEEWKNKEANLNRDAVYGYFSYMLGIVTDLIIQEHESKGGAKTSPK